MTTGTGRYVSPHPPRRLSANQKALFRLDLASRLNFAALAHVRAKTQPTSLDAGRVRAALLGLQARHPLLRALIELRRGVPWFVWPPDVPPIPLEEHSVGRDDWP